ncbi:MAG: acyl-CoA thioesterase/BAAT N-terminal domain-containing protein [Acidimicrobiales bacterium]
MTEGSQDSRPATAPSRAAAGTGASEVAAVAPDPAAHRGGGAGAWVVGFAPWILYWILVGNASFRVAVAVALGLSVVIVVGTLARHRRPMVLELGTLVFFVVLLGLAFVASDAFLARWIQPLGNAGLALVVLGSILVGRPFTLDYAKAATDPSLWDNPGFVYVNRLLSWVWFGCMSVMALVSAVPPLVQGDATVADAGQPLSVACYWVIPFSLLGLTMVFTLRFPDWFTAGFDAPPVLVDGLQPDEVDADPSHARPSEGRLAVRVDPPTSGLDDPLAIVVEGADPGTPVVVSLDTVDAGGHVWHGEATFTARADGGVDATADAPVDGAYAGVDGDGLLWSMAFDSAGEAPDLYLPPWGPAGFSLRAETGGRSVTTTFVRRAAAEGVVTREVREGDLVARLFLPPGAADGTGGPVPGVVLFPGSEGGLDSMSADAAVLASHGAAALVAAYFNADRLPSQLAEIPLERLASAITWLAGHDAVAGPVTALAISRGAEGLLATAAAVDGLPLRAIVALSPSHVTWEALGDDGDLPGVSAWTLAGAAQPALAASSGELMADMARQALRHHGRVDPRHPLVMHLTRSYEPALGDAEAVDAARILVERIPVPLLLVSGDDDQVWPSGRMAAAVLASRSGGPAAAADHHVTYPGAGHLLRLGTFPTTATSTGGIALGGTAAGTAVAQRDLTARVVRLVTGR